MENEIPENVNQAQSTTNDPSIGQQILDSIADNALYQAFDSAVDKIVDVTRPAINAITDAASTTVKKVVEGASEVADKVDVSDAAELTSTIFEVRGTREKKHAEQHSFYLLLQETLILPYQFFHQVLLLVHHKTLL